MKISKWVEVEVVGEISLHEVFESLAELPEDESQASVMLAINSAGGVLKRIPDRAIVSMTEAQRKIIGEVLQKESARYLTLVNSLPTPPSTEAVG